MKSAALIMAVVGVVAGAAWAVPTYTHTAVNLGGGLYGFTFTIDNPGQPASAWFVEMEWRGMTQEEIDEHCLCEPGMFPWCHWVPGAVPGTIIQSLGFGNPVHEEAAAITADSFDPSYSMALDTWIMEEFCHNFQGGTPTEGANSFYVESGTEAGMPYVAVDHAYVVADGSFAYEGRLGMGLVDPIWTPVSDCVCIVPEPGTLGLLALGGLALIRRRR